MSSDCDKNEDVDNVFDGTCWESARSSWIYMEMEPRQREYWMDNSFRVSAESADHSFNCCVGLDSMSVVIASRDSSGVKGDTEETNCESIQNMAFGRIDEDCSVIHEENVNDESCFMATNGLLSNSNFILKKDSGLDSPCVEDHIHKENWSKPTGHITSAARRSVSLDSYPVQKAQTSLIKQSETVHFPQLMSRCPALPPLHMHPERFSKCSLISSPLYQRVPVFPSPSSRRTFTTRNDIETDRESVMSVCTMATVSTTGSCNSLYRIPTKLRKLSSSSNSGNSSWSAFISKNKLSLSDRTKLQQCPISVLPNLLRDTFSYLWRENPDRDPFNTFSVSETDLTTVIAHLEQELSQSTGKKEENSRISLLSNFMQLDSHLAPSTSTGIQSPEPCIHTVNEDGSTEPSSLPFRVQFIMENYCNIYMTRKQDLRELKMLQKQENKQITDLQYKNQIALEAKERKFDTDSTTLRKTFDQDLDALNKQQKQLIERAEQAQQTDVKNAARKLKTEQDKELKLFRDKQKQEMKLLKQELDLLPRDNKKETAQKLRETKQIEMEEKDRVFLENQAERMEKHLKQLADQHRQKIALLENQCLQQKQQLYRAREASVWEMEKNQLHERHQLLKTQLKDMFFVKRHQMLTRHQKEMENLKRYNQTKEDEMLNRHAMERRRMPKILKSETKTRAMMFKQSLRLSNIGTPEDDKTKIKQFEESEKKRIKSEQLRQEEKHKKQLKTLTDKNEATVKELEQLQAEKRKMLMEQETQKIKEIDDQFAGDMTKWKAMLIPRKQAIEDQFQREVEEQQSFYSVRSGESAIHAMLSMHSGSVRSKGKDGTINSRHSTIL